MEHKEICTRKESEYFFLTDKRFKILSANPRVSIRSIDLRNDSHLDWK